MKSSQKKRVFSFSIKHSFLIKICAVLLAAVWTAAAFPALPARTVNAAGTGIGGAEKVGSSGTEGTGDTAGTGTGGTTGTGINSASETGTGSTSGSDHLSAAVMPKIAGVHETAQTAGRQTATASAETAPGAEGSEGSKGSAGSEESEGSKGPEASEDPAGSEGPETSEGSGTAAEPGDASENGENGGDENEGGVFIELPGDPEEAKSLPVQTNEIDGWPQGPAVSARSAILVEANTGTLLYAKNIHEPHYPASVTKLLTAAIARYNSDLNDNVVYTSEIVHSINWLEDSNIGIKPDEVITMEQSLYGLLVGSGNECGNAIGAHISGSAEAFVDLMNRTAKEIGCVDSHFVTTNGIHDDQHYTSAYDLALIAECVFSDELLSRMTRTASYTIPQSATVSQQLVINSKNRLFEGKEYAYGDLVGSKTGYTSLAGQTLVSCAERDGMKLICVVLCDGSPMQFTDTVDLFNYGFSNFRAVNVSENDDTFTIQGNTFFMADKNIFGENKPLLSVDKDAMLILPADASPEDLQTELRYDGVQDGQAALVSYTCCGQPVGTAAILFTDPAVTFDFDAQPTETEGAETEETASGPKTVSGLMKLTTRSPFSGDNVIFLNVRRIVIVVAAIAAALILLLILRSVIHSRRLMKRRSAIIKRHREKRDEIIDFDKYTNPLE